MKKLIAFFLLITICMSLTFPASAVDSVDENQWTYAPVEMFANNSAQEGSARAGIEVDMYRSSYKIPDSTSMLSRSIVSAGIITYEIRVGILVTNNGTASANQSVTWSTTAASTQAKFISGDSKTNSYGQAFAYFHVRNLASLPVRAVCAGVTTNTSIEVPTAQLYKIGRAHV